MAHRDNIECWLTDMDGVLVHENDAIPGASELLAGWEQNEIPYLVLTNNSIFTAPVSYTHLTLPTNREV